MLVPGSDYRINPKSMKNWCPGVIYAGSSRINWRDILLSVKISFKWLLRRGWVIGQNLGRPLRDKTIYSEQKRLERLEAGERNAVEGKFGEGKRFLSLNRLMTRLQHTSEVGINLVFLVMNLDKFLRDILLSMLRWLLDYRFAAALW